ncbi:NADH-quinone oxidoreductase subunit L [Ketogulonicigenium robustum]|uniref:NADH-quinone oxidoreductase subunit L n=1 Tax=Ketogulonicigenium robustum TaxID=92947 RepID=A0A1W6P131_9RHOB|nr:NADH-quinone oxidoreductase subunit L [Ketogulonicigenium robustum]ARO15218.1 NADH-quinone oxidoreductase subunit L [Ketogulonicigenium robustum]
MEHIILLAPLVGAVVTGFGWRALGEQLATWVATGIMLLVAALSWVVFFRFAGDTQVIHLLRLIDVGTLQVDWAIRLDRLSAIMLVVINSVSALVHLYSLGYMAHDDNFAHGESYRPRFFAYLSLFTFAMLLLVTADNLVQLFVGWEGVGLASFLLIGFYFRKDSANAAAMKAFVVNRVGDLGLYLAMMVLFLATGSLNFADIFAAAPALAESGIPFLWRDWSVTELAALLLFVGAMGKSAQLFLHTWLPDAMEGPTPVSALIHAATMVTAGVFLLCRMSPILEFAPIATGFVVVIGAATAFYAATVALVQNDIKRVIAYSTCSQLGYMFVAVGVGAYGVAMFHLFTHAFFKALLFLGAGSVIHATDHEQDMRNYGGLAGQIPFTFAMMMIGTLAITGVGIPLTQIGFAGFLSKDAVIESAFAGAGFLPFAVLVVAAALTSFYSWRLIFLTFFGKARGDGHHHPHESPLVMLVPMAVLAVGAVLAGVIWVGDFFGHVDQVGAFFGIPVADAGHHHYAFTGQPGQGALFIAPDNHVLDDAHAVPAWVKVAPFVAMLLGLAVAVVFYITRPALPAQLAARWGGVHAFLMNRWYFDELYDRVFVRPAQAIGRALWHGGDEAVIDGALNGVAMGLIPRATRALSRAQTGYLFHYAFAMVIGVVILLLWLFLFAGGR